TPFLRTLRSSERKRRSFETCTPSLAAERALDRNGQLRPLQTTVTRAPAGAFTDRSRSWVPPRLMRPASRTTGNGLSRRKVGDLREGGAIAAGAAGAWTVMSCVETFSTFSLSTTFRPTLYVPGAGKIFWALEPCASS